MRTVESWRWLATLLERWPIGAHKFGTDCISPSGRVSHYQDSLFLCGVRPGSWHCIQIEYSSEGRIQQIKGRRPEVTADHTLMESMARMSLNGSLHGNAQLDQARSVGSSSSNRYVSARYSRNCS